MWDVKIIDFKYNIILICEIRNLKTVENEIPPILPPQNNGKHGKLGGAA